jgi:hypothetical protein
MQGAGSGTTTEGPDPSSSSGLGMTSRSDTTTATHDSSSSAGSLDSGSTTEACPLAAMGSPCTDPVCDCASGNCFVAGPLGGVCSECDEDADCPGSTCAFGNPTTMTPAACVPLERPQGCVTADDCPVGMYCPTVFEVPGLLSYAECSECESDRHCMAGQLCVPTYDINAATGHYDCTDPGSVPDGEGCNLAGDGSECASGQCAQASLMEIPIMGVCSPCNEDSDCKGGTCQLPELLIVDVTLQLEPGACV